MLLDEPVHSWVFKERFVTDNGTLNVLLVAKLLQKTMGRAETGCRMKAKMKSDRMGRPKGMEFGYITQILSFASPNPNLTVL